MEKPNAQPKSLSEKTIGERSISLARDLETKAASTAMDEVHAYKKTMSPADYASMVRGVASVNKFDREQNPSLPKVIITDNGGTKAEISGVVRDVVDPRTAVGTAARPDTAEKQKPAQSDGNYTNTAIGREKMWRDTFR
ncbi:hypothetical protein BH10CYA1_BH10CYA1_08920 [soil metagenome]